MYLSLLFMVLQVETVFGAGNNCEDNVYMRIPYTQKLIYAYYESAAANSPQHCLELCKDHPTCKSVGIQTTTMTCYKYNDRVYAGLSGTITDDMIYYWLLEEQCPVDLGYTEEPNSKICHKYNSTAVTWSEAQAQCEREGGHLFIMDTDDKRSLMNQYATTGNVGRLIYLGGTDAAEEAVWNWLNGQPILTTDWKSGEPNNNLGAEHCLAYDTNHLKVDDRNCKNNYKFMCEIPSKPRYNP